MMLALRLGLRNVVRYAQRTLITTSTIALSFSMLVLTVGIAEGSYASWSTTPRAPAADTSWSSPPATICWNRSL